MIPTNMHHYHQKGDGRPIKYMTNVVNHNDKLYVAVSCWGEVTINLEPDDDSFY